MASSSKRRYSSTARAQSAELTRKRVLDAARALFADVGVDRATIASIANAANVAAPTVYAQFSSKVGILRALMSEALFGPAFEEARRKLEGVQDPVDLIGISADVMCAIYSSESDQLGMIRGVSYLSPELRETEQEFEEMRLAMQRDRVERLFRCGLARPGLTFAEAQRILWMYTSRDVYRMMVEESGWSLDHFRTWLSRTLIEALVDPSAWPPQHQTASEHLSDLSQDGWPTT